MDKSTIDKEDIQKQAKIALDRLKQTVDSQNWKKYDKKPCQMYTMEVDGRIAAKGNSIVNFSIQKILQFLCNYKTIKLINPMIEKCQQLERYSHNLQVIYQTFGGLGPVSGRDFVICLYMERQGNKAYISSVSSQYPYPLAKGFIRGIAYTGGYVLQQIEQKKTKLTFVADADIKGNMPGFIKNQVSKRQGSIAAKIEPLMKELNYTD